MYFILYLFQIIAGQAAVHLQSDDTIYSCITGIVHYCTRSLIETPSLEKSSAKSGYVT